MPCGLKCVIAVKTYDNQKVALTFEESDKVPAELHTVIPRQGA